MLHELVHVFDPPEKTFELVGKQEICRSSTRHSWYLTDITRWCTSGTEEAKCRGGENDMSMIPEAHSFFAFALWLGTVKDPNEPDKPLYDWSNGRARNPH